jgi:hypothetical protein
MDAIVKRIGYFLREGVKGTTAGEQNRYFIIRYFLIDNQHGIYYTDNFAQLIHLVKSSRTLKEAFEKADKELKKIKISEIKVSEVKKYAQPEILSFLNKIYIDVAISMSSDLADNSTLTGAKGEEVMKFMFFTFKDHHLPVLQRFLSTYDKHTALPQRKDEENEPLDWEVAHPKVANKQQQLEKALQDKLDGLAEQLSHVKEIEEAIAETENKKAGLTLLTSSGDKDSTIEQKPIHTEDSTGKLDDGANEGTPTEDHQSLADSTGIVKTESSNLSSPTSANYSGPMIGGKAEGKGKEHINDDISYVGDYRAGKRHGIGYFVLANQGICYVESINGKISGI